MPTAPPSFRPRRPGRKRASASARGYDARWKRLRAAYLVDHPVCQLQKKCNGAPATEVDHVQTIRSGGERLDEFNLMAVCKRCHSWKTRTQDQTFYGDEAGG